MTDSQMCFCDTKTTAAPHLAGAFHGPCDPRPAFRWTRPKALRPLDCRPGRVAPGPRQGGDFISPLTLDREAFRPWTPDHGGDFALPLDPHRAGLEGRPALTCTELPGQVSGTFPAPAWTEPPHFCRAIGKEWRHG